MPTVHRAHGFRIAIYFDDHPPPHVHALRAGSDVRILLDEECTVDRIYGASRSEVERCAERSMSSETAC
jgi:hypothetical protein